MEAFLFDRPVHLICTRRTVTKIRCARDGFEFLLTCPVQEGPIFESALEVCFAALSNPSLSNDARRGITTFARIHGLLAVNERAQAVEHKLRQTWHDKDARLH